MFGTFCHLCYGVGLGYFLVTNQEANTIFGRNGKVAQGMFDILQELPLVNVSVQDLPTLVANPGLCCTLVESLTLG